MSKSLLIMIAVVSLFIAFNTLQAVPESIVAAISNVADDAQYKTLNEYISLQWRDGNREELEKINQLVDEAYHTIVGLRDSHVRKYYDVYFEITGYEIMTILLFLQSPYAFLLMFVAGPQMFLVIPPLLLPLVAVGLGIANDIRYKWQNGEKKIEHLTGLRSMLETVLVMTK